MDALERASKIAEEYCLGEFTTEKYGEFVTYLAAAIEEAEREARVNERSKRFDEECRNAFLNGFRAAREQAGVIADRGNCPQRLCNCCHIVADRIRAMKSDGEGAALSDVGSEGEKA